MRPGVLSNVGLEKFLENPVKIKILKFNSI